MGLIMMKRRVGIKFSVALCAQNKLTGLIYRNIAPRCPPPLSPSYLRGRIRPMTNYPSKHQVEETVLEINPDYCVELDIPKHLLMSRGTGIVYLPEG